MATFLFEGKEIYYEDHGAGEPLLVLNGIFMIITQRLMPTAGMDPMQRKIMMWLPVVFAVMFALFPAGLVLYWATNAGVSLAQQWAILKRLEREG